jgi:hypothetical protein
MVEKLFNCIRKVRKGEELRAPRHASAVASCDDHVTIYDIIPNNKSSPLI